MQSLAVPALHVPHDASHDWQRSRLSTYVPLAHELTHAPICRIGKLDVSSQVVHVVALEQVAHDASHAAHVVPSACKN